MPRVRYLDEIKAKAAKKLAKADRIEAGATRVEVVREFHLGNVTMTLKSSPGNYSGWPMFDMKISVYPNQSIEPDRLRDMASILVDFADEVESDEKAYRKWLDGIKHV